MTVAQRVAPPGRLAAVASALTLVWVIAWAIGVAVLPFDGGSVNTWFEWAGNSVVRLALCLVLLGVVHHWIEGGVRLLAGLQDRPSPQDARWSRTVVWFVTFAAGIPLAFVVLWPSIDGWLS